MGSRRLLPLLALLGAAGLQSSEWEGPPAPEPSTTLEPEQPLPGRAAPPGGSPLSSAASQPSLAVASADPERSPGGGPGSPAAAGCGPALGAAGGRTRPPLLEAGRTAAVGAPSLPPTSPSASGSVLTLLPALLPGSPSPTDVAGPTAGRPSAPEGVSHSGREGSTRGGRPAPVTPLLQGAPEQVANRAGWTEAGPRTPEPGSSRPAGGTAAAAARGASGVADAAEGWRTPAVEPPWPRGAGSRVPGGSRSSPPTAGAPGGRLLPAPTGPPAEDSAGPASRGAPTLPGTVGLEGAAASALAPLTRLPPHQGRSRSARPNEPPEPLSLGTALPPSLAGTGHPLEATEEAAAPGSTAGSTTGAPGPAAATLGQDAGGTEAAALPPSGAAPSPGLGGSAAPPSGSDPALCGCSPTSLAPSVGTARPPAGPTGGSGTSLATAPPQSSADPPPVSGSAPLPVSSRDPPGPSPPLLQGASPGPARPADAKEEAQRAPPAAAPRQSSPLAPDGPGTATERVQPLLSQAPSLTGGPEASWTASLSGSLSWDPAGPPSGAAAPSPSAEPASEAGASGRPWEALRPGASPARTPRWEWGRRPPPGATTESPAGGTLARAPRSTAPAPTAAPSGPVESAWPPGGASRGSAAVDSPWLLAPGSGEAPTRPAPAVPSDVRGRGRRVFVAENQLPLLKAALLRVPCELVLAMEFSGSLRNPRSSEYLDLVLSVNDTVAPLLAPLPGFQRLEVKSIRPGSVVVQFDALFLAEALGLWAALNRSWLAERLPPGLRVADARVLRSTALERRLDLCALLFACHAGYECIAGEDGNAACTSLCHRDYCHNQGICTHEAHRGPVCQCPVGSDFWYLGLRCNYRVTQQGLLGVACALLLSLGLVGTAVASLVIRRVRLLLLEARADQTKSSYRRFCRLDDVSAHYWSEPWLASGSSLDNPAFSRSEELLHLQVLDPDCCGCQDDCGGPSSCCRQTQDAPGIGAAGRPGAPLGWASSSTSVNDPMVDSGKASEVSVCSWPLEPLQWSPFPALHKLSGQQAHKSPPRPHSYCEGLELVSLERSWTA